MLCSKIPCQKGLNLVLVSYIILLSCRMALLSFKYPPVQKDRNDSAEPAEGHRRTKTTQQKWLKYRRTETTQQNRPKGRVLIQRVVLVEPR